MKYRIMTGDTVLYEDLTLDDWCDRMMDLAQQYYLTGFPKPEDLHTETTEN